MLKYFDDRLGFFCEFDQAYIMDDFGNAVPVPWSLPSAWYWQNH